MVEPANFNLHELSYTYRSSAIPPNVILAEPAIQPVITTESINRIIGAITVEFVAMRIALYPVTEIVSFPLIGYAGESQILTIVG